MGRAVLRHDLLCFIALQVRDGQQQVLGGNVLVLKIAGFFEGLLKQLVTLVRERGLRGLSRNLWKLLDFGIDRTQHGLRPDSDFFEHRRNDALLVFQ